MKSGVRRNIATLSFVATLAIIYIIVAGRRNNDVVQPIGKPLIETESVPAVSKADTAASDKRQPAARKKSGKTKKQKIMPQDNPEVFDAPVAPI